MTIVIAGKIMASEPTHVVSWELFKHNQLPYLELRRPFILGSEEVQWRPTVAHFFMRVCADQGLLQRLYTQNIDGLDQVFVRHAVVGVGVCMLLYPTGGGLPLFETIFKTYTMQMPVEYIPKTIFLSFAFVANGYLKGQDCQRPRCHESSVVRAVRRISRPLLVCNAGPLNLGMTAVILAGRNKTGQSMRTHPAFPDTHDNAHKGAHPYPGHHWSRQQSPKHFHAYPMPAL